MKSEVTLIIDIANFIFLKLQAIRIKEIPAKTQKVIAPPNNASFLLPKSLPPVDIYSSSSVYFDSFQNKKPRAVNSAK